MAVATPLEDKVRALVRYRDEDLSIEEGAKAAGVHQTTFSTWLRKVKDGDIELPEPTTNGHTEEEAPAGTAVALVDPPSPPGNVLVYQDELAGMIDGLGAKIDGMLEVEAASVGELTERIAMLEDDKANLAQRVGGLERALADMKVSRDEARDEAELWRDTLIAEHRRSKRIIQDVG